MLRLSNLRGGIRLLRQRPLFAATVILVVGLGIGVNTLVFTVTDAVLLRPLPYQDRVCAGSGLQCLALAGAILFTHSRVFRTLPQSQRQRLSGTDSNGRRVGRILVTAGNATYCRQGFPCKRRPTWSGTSCDSHSWVLQTALWRGGPLRRSNNQVR